MDGFDSQTVDPPDRCRAAPSGAVFFSSEVHTATCAASQRSNLRPQASAAPPLTRPCPRGVTQLARLAPIARTDRPREHSARQARRVPARTSHRQRSATPALLAILRGWLAKQLRKIDLQPPGGPVIADGVQVVCPQNAVTKGIAATSASQCVCIAGYYNHRPSNATVECILCPAGSKCVDRGTTLASLPLWAAAAGLFRSFNLSWGC